MATSAHTSSGDDGKAPAKKVFVISPIGGKDSDTRVHANRFLNYIVKPALPEPEYEVLRADEDDSAYAITESMLRAILEADICVADITGRNPNVMYELALAHAADKKVVIMNSDDAPVPFDIKDQRVVPYGLMPEEVAEAIIGLRAKVTHEPDARLRSMLNPVADAFRDWTNVQRVESSASSEAQALARLVENLDRKVDRVLTLTTNQGSTLRGVSRPNERIVRERSALMRSAQSLLNDLEFSGHEHRHQSDLFKALNEQWEAGHSLTQLILEGDADPRLQQDLKQWVESTRQILRTAPRDPSVN